MKRLTGWLGLTLSRALFRAPRWIRCLLANALACAWFDILRIRRVDALNNIAIAFPDLSSAAGKRIARKSLRNLAMNLIEYSYLPWLTPQNVDDYFNFENLAAYDAALAHGRGALLLTLHLGHGDLGCAALSLKGYRMVLVSKFFRARWLNDLWFGMREKAGTRFVPPRNSSYALLRALRQGSSVIFPLDQFTGPPIGVRTQFFNRETGTAAGLAVMAARSKAPVILCYAYRTADGRHHVHFEKEIPITGLSTEAATQVFNDELERIVRLYPEQWMWIHRRWKQFRDQG